MYRVLTENDIKDGKTRKAEDVFSGLRQKKLDKSQKMPYT